MVRESQSTPTGASADSAFADSAIMDMTTPTISVQSKPQFETDAFESETVTPLDDMSEWLDNEDELLEHAIGTSGDPSDEIVSLMDPSSQVKTRELSPESEAGTECGFEHDPELVSHFTTTVSSLRLRHQEQMHLQSLFTSKLEALAQRSLEHEATIWSLTTELQSLRSSNTQLSSENTTLVCENNNLRASMQDLKGEVVERETAMEAMTGAVRGLEGWIESANHSPRSSSQRHSQQDKMRHRRGGRGAVRGQGRFRGRYYADEEEESLNTNGGLGGNKSTEIEPVEIQEGVMAWVRGFRDVEEVLKVRSEIDGKETRTRQVNGRTPGHQSNDTTDAFDEDFGDFETAG